MPKLHAHLRRPPEVIGANVSNCDHPELEGFPVVAIYVTKDEAQPEYGQALVLTLSTAEALSHDLRNVITRLKAMLN